MVVRNEAVYLSLLLLIPFSGFRVAKVIFLSIRKISYSWFLR